MHRWLNRRAPRRTGLVEPGHVKFYMHPSPTDLMRDDDPWPALYLVESRLYCSAYE